MAEKGTMTATFEPTLDVWKLLAGEPTEYIVVNPTVLEVRFKDGKVRRYPQDIRERIVRCRDCANYRPAADEDHEDGCALAYANLFETSPDGFCAWGERKGDS